MNILLINHYAGSKIHGMEYRPYYLSREWVRMGHQVTVVAASFAHRRDRSPEMNGPVTEEWIDGIRYVWLRTPAYYGNNFGRIRNILAFLARLYIHRRRLSRHGPPHVVIASSTYPLDIYPAWSIARRFGAMLVYEVHDLWPLTPAQIGGMPSWHPYIWILQRAEDFCCKHADRVVSILPRADLHLVERGMSQEKFFHIPNGVDVAEWGGMDAALPELHIQEIERLKGPRSFLVGYAGAYGLANALHYLLGAAEILRDDRFGFVLVGGGPKKEELSRRIVQKNLQNVLILPPVPKKSIPAFLSQMDCLYLDGTRQPLYRFGVSPNKLFDYMMAAKPIINCLEASNDPVAECECGISVSPEDSQAIAAAIARLAELGPETRGSMGERGRQYVLQHHDYRHLAKRFLEVLQ